MPVIPDLPVSDGYVRTLPHYVPQFTAWRSVRMQILVCDSMRERIDVRVTVEEVHARFNWLLGPQTIEITAWKKLGSPKDTCVGEVTIWPRASGKPKLVLSSPDSTFATTIIETREQGAFARFESVDNRSAISDWEYRRRRAKRLAKKTGTALLACIPVGILGWWFITHSVPQVTTSLPTATQVIASAPVTETPAEPMAVGAPPEPSLTMRMDCIFMDPERTKDADGKVTVKCLGVIVQATATYMGEGRFEFTYPAAPSP